MPTTTDTIANDPEDFAELEPADRPNWWDVVLYDATGRRHVLTSAPRKAEAEAMVTTIRTTIGTWDGFAPYDPNA